MKRILFAVLAALAFALPAFAQEPVNDPLFSLKRLSAAAGVEREVLRSYADEAEAWRAVLPVAYNLLSPQPGQSGIRFSLTARPSIAFHVGASAELYLGARISLLRESR